MAARKRKLTTGDDVQNLIFESDSELYELCETAESSLSILQHQKN